MLPSETDIQMVSITYPLRLIFLRIKCQRSARKIITTWFFRVFLLYKSTSEHAPAMLMQTWSVAKVLVILKASLLECREEKNQGWSMIPTIRCFSKQPLMRWLTQTVGPCYSRAHTGLSDIRNRGWSFSTSAKDGIHGRCSIDTRVWENRFPGKSS